jgi:hypothetical protein
MAQRKRQGYKVIPAMHIHPDMLRLVEREAERRSISIAGVVREAIAEHYGVENADRSKCGFPENRRRVT